MACLTKVRIWLSALRVTQIAKIATESQILAAQTVHLNIGLLRQSRLVFLMDLAPMGIIPM
jgi:hypothetical protein